MKSSTVSRSAPGPDLSSPQSYASLTAGLYLCARLLFGRELYFWDYIIYSAIDLLGAAAIIAAVITIRQAAKSRTESGIPIPC